MTDDRGAAALAERLRAFDVPSSYDEWLARHDATYEGDAAFILGEHGVFLPGGHSGCDMDIAYEAGVEDGEAEVERLRDVLDAMREYACHSQLCTFVVEMDMLPDPTTGARGQCDCGFDAVLEAQERAALSPEPPRA